MVEQDYPSGSWGAKLQEQETLVDKLPWLLRRHYRRKINSFRR